MNIRYSERLLEMLAFIREPDFLNFALLASLVLGGWWVLGRLRAMGQRGGGDEGPGL